MKQSKIKVKTERKEQQLYIEYEHKKKNYLAMYGFYASRMVRKLN